jgi:hypothetical protein
MTALKLDTFHFRCMNGDIVSAPAIDETTARSIAMEQRWGPPQYNQTWHCAFWQGKGLALVDKHGFVKK